MRLFELFCSISLSGCLAIAVRYRDCNYTLHSSNTSDCIDAHGNQSTAKLITATNHLVNCHYSNQLLDSANYLLDHGFSNFLGLFLGMLHLK